MDKLIAKNMSILSFIIGLIGGVLVIIPLINIFVFLAVIFLSSVIVYFYFKRKEEIGLFEPKQAAAYGALSGFVSFLGFSCTMVPLALILSFINSIWFHKMVWFSFIKTVFSLGLISGTVIMLMFVFFVALLSAILNAFSAMVTVFIMQTVDGTDKEKDEFKIDVEIK